jgi:hypothetical protein
LPVHLDDEVVARLGSHLEPGSAGEVPIGGEPMPVMVAIADDLPVARQGLRDYLQCEGDLEVAAAVDSGAALQEILGGIGVSLTWRSSTRGCHRSTGSRLRAGSKSGRRREGSSSAHSMTMTSF